MEPISLAKRLLPLMIPLALSSCASMQMGRGGNIAPNSVVGELIDHPNSQLVQNALLLSWIESRSGSAAHVTAALIHCAVPLGTMVIPTSSEAPWYKILTTSYGLPNPDPVFDLIVKQSNCFMIVSRGHELKESIQERGLAQSNDLRKASDFQRHQKVAVDYVMWPGLKFSNYKSGGLVAAGAPYMRQISDMQVKGVRAFVTIFDDHSHGPSAFASGNARSFNFSGFDALFGSRIVGLDGYQNKAQGKVIVGAFVVAYDRVVHTLQHREEERRIIPPD